MWSPECSQDVEASKIRWELVPYFRGRVLDLGCGKYKTFPHFIGVDIEARTDVKADAKKLDLFATGSCDTVFSSYLLQTLDYDCVTDTLNEWIRTIKADGHLILYLPDDTEYPKVGAKDCNPDTKWDVSYDKIVAAMEKVSIGWDLVDFQIRSADDEYSLFFVFKVVPGGDHSFSYKDAKPEKKCAVVRLGAFGDMVQSSSIYPGLKAQGYHLTLYCSSAGYDVVKHDPHVDRFIIQGTNEVPPQFLGEFWGYEKKKYDKWVNLSESVEVTLLAAPDHTNHGWPQSVKAKYMDVNYLEFTHELAEVPPPYLPKFYSTVAEKAWAKDKARSYGQRNILWSLSGSSGHKTWPHLDAIIARIMLYMKDTHVVLVGDELSQILEAGWEKEKRVHRRSGVWSIRESMAFAEVSDLIIGTETGLLNAAGCMGVPKIVTLSHSSPEMLTKHWKNTIALEQPKGVGCPKYPCRMLHFNWDHCMKHEETGTAVCQNEITVEMMYDAICKTFEMKAAA